MTFAASVQPKCSYICQCTLSHSIGIACNAYLYSTIAGGNDEDLQLPISHKPMYSLQSHTNATEATSKFLGQYEVDDTNTYLVSNFGGTIEDH